MCSNIKNLRCTNKNVVKITISILTYNRCSILKELLFSLKKLKYSPLEIIVVDNCSKDETQKKYFRNQ